MKQYLYNGKVITASSKKEAIHKIVSYPMIDKYVSSNIDEFIDKVSKLSIGGKKLFEAKRFNDYITIKLLCNKYKAEMSDSDLYNFAMYNLNVLFPITKEWCEANSHYYPKAKEGDLILYTSEWSHKEFSDTIEIDYESSKVDEDNFDGYLMGLYEELEKDCNKIAKLKGFKVGR